MTQRRRQEELKPLFSEVEAAAGVAVHGGGGVQALARAQTPSCSALRVQGSGFRVQGLGFSV